MKTLSLGELMRKFFLIFVDCLDDATLIDNFKSILRDQNFGLNDLAAIQDVRNDFTQQDIDESTVIKDKGMKEM
jgi:hypothetical protein